MTLNHEGLAAAIGDALLNAFPMSDKIAHHGYGAVAAKAVIAFLAENDLSAAHPAGDGLEEMVDRAVQIAIDTDIISLDGEYAGAPGVRLMDYLEAKPGDAAELGVRLTKGADGKPRWHGYSDVAVDEQRTFQEKLLTPIVRAILTEPLAALSAERARVEDLTRGRDEARNIARNLTKALVGLTPGGSEYFTRSDILDDYFADADQCTRVVRERFESGHQAKIERTDERRRADAAEAEVKRLREALTPFANKSKAFDDAGMAIIGAIPHDSVVVKISVTHGDLRAIRAALTKEGGNGE